MVDGNTHISISPFADIVCQLLQRQKKQMKPLGYNKQLRVFLPKMKGPFFAATVSIRGGTAQTPFLVRCQLVLIVIYLDKAWKGVCFI